MTNQDGGIAEQWGTMTLKYVILIIASATVAEGQRRNRKPGLTLKNSLILK